MVVSLCLYQLSFIMGRDYDFTQRGWMSTSDYNHYRDGTKSPPSSPPPPKKVKKEGSSPKKEDAKPQVDHTKKIVTKVGDHDINVIKTIKETGDKYRLRMTTKSD